MVLAATCMVQAAVTSIDAIQIAQAVVPNTITNDIVIDFEGNLRGQQMILTLTGGSIYQDPLGSNTPPNSAFFGLAPSVQYDTFVAVGGRQSDGAAPPASQAILVVGGAVDLQPGSALKFDAQGLNVAWAPGTGVDVPNGTDYPMARITLSNDAAGSLQYFGSTGAGTGDPLTKTFQIMNGIIGGTQVTPVVNDLALNNAVLNATVNGNVTGTDVANWSPTLEFIGYTQAYGGQGTTGVTTPALAATWDPNTQAFSWNTAGSLRGDYQWRVTGLNGEASDTGLITVAQQAVPEPATLSLIGLALFGFAGAARRRG